MKRPRRQRKGDRLLDTDASAKENACHFSLAPLDHLASLMDQKWGIDRLPELVAPAMAQKYGLAISHLNECMKELDPEKTLAASENCIRGLHAMDAAAEANGAPKATGHIFEFELEAEEGGEPMKFAVLADSAQWQAAKEKRPDLIFFSQREVALAMRAWLKSPLVVETKKHFTKAEIMKPDPPVDYKNGGDEIPF